MFKLNTMHNNFRMSTQDVLLSIEEAVHKGETEFEIHASGQHDIGGPLWNSDGKTLHFHVYNPGQRVGSMCMDNTEILVEGSSSADVGWLNAGGMITVRGDAGDTAGHCAAGGKIYIGGRAGTRSGSLMKHDPLYQAPELWILKNTGSFSFEFMGGGKAVVCGYGCETLPSVLGERPCVGMVGGTVYFRGRIAELSAELPTDVKACPLDKDDQQWLEQGLNNFLQSVARPELRNVLSRWEEWQKIIPAQPDAADTMHRTIAEFRQKAWVQGGIFSDVFEDDFKAIPLLNHGENRLRVPEWKNALYAAPCEFQCPAGIPSQKRFNLLRQGKHNEAYSLVLQYTPFPASVCGSVCPNPCMDACTRGSLDTPVQIGMLGRFSSVPELAELACAPATGKKVAIIGGGVGGLSAAWQLALLGHEVTVYEADSVMGGKLEQVIPRARLPHEFLEKELSRIEKIGVQFIANYPVNAEKFQKIRREYDAVVAATGGHVARIFPWPGSEKIIGGIDFLKAVNRGENPSVGKNVIVIGCGNAGMDAASGAYAMGAEHVTCIDVQKPAAFAHEIAHVESMGGTLVWPIRTKEITEEGLITEDGTLIPGDMVIITVGESPDLSYLPTNVKKFKDWLASDDKNCIMEGVFAVGDAIKPGLLVQAIASGIKAADSVQEWLTGEPPVRTTKKRIPESRLHTSYFNRVQTLPPANEDFKRCVSCGSCRDCSMCLSSCPHQAITRKEFSDGTFLYESDPERCIGCGICAGICPCGIWSMTESNGGV